MIKIVILTLWPVIYDSSRYSEGLLSQRIFITEGFNSEGVLFKKINKGVILKMK